MPGQPQPAGVDPKRRPLFGQGTMQSSLVSSAPTQQPFVAGRPIVKGTEKFNVIRNSLMKCIDNLDRFLLTEFNVSDLVRGKCFITCLVTNNI